MADNETLEVSKYFRNSELILENQSSRMNKVSGIRPSLKRKAKDKHSTEQKYAKSKTPSKVEPENNDIGQGIHKSVSLKLKEVDFIKSGVSLAKFLLGKLLVRVCDNGHLLSGRIVETEAYLGEIDNACHTYGGKRTERTQPMYMMPGTLYVYFIYGMYHCLNISSEDVGGCVLIRAIEPIQG